MTRFFEYVLRALFILALLTLPFLASCKKEEDSFGAGQRSSQAEIQQQNQNLIAQFVSSTDSLEHHNDLNYLQNNLSRLGNWLKSQPATKNPQSLPEFDVISRSFSDLSHIAAEIQKVGEVFLNPEQKPTQEQGDQLSSLCDQFVQTAAPLTKQFHSPVLNLYISVAQDSHKALEGAKEYQFGDQGQLMRSALLNIKTPEMVNFEMFADRANELSRLYRLDGRDFLPEDAYHFNNVVWERNVLQWAKGEQQEDLDVVLSLFDWTCEEIALLEHGFPSPASGEIHTMPWETMLLSQGRGIDRAEVFMGLLRQYRIDSFIVRPTRLSEEEIDSFPVVVAVLVDGVPLLFLPELGLPIPGKSAEGASFSLPKEGKNRALKFHTIATLDEVATDDSLLRQLDLSESEPFPLHAEDFQEVTAFVPAGPFELSERMQLAENEFSSEIYTVLSTLYAPLCEKILASESVKKVEPCWDFQTSVIEQTLMPELAQGLIGPYLFTVQVREDLSTEKSEKTQKGQAPEGAESDDKYTSVMHKEIMTLTPLWGGKILYFAGKFSGDKGAVYWLQQGKVPERLLKQAMDKIRPRTEAFIQQIREESAKSGQNLTEEQIKALATHYIQQEQQEIFFQAFFKTAIRYDLALVSRALGNFNAAIDHINSQLQDTQLLEQVGQVWKIPSLIMLARIHEEKGEYTEAIALYRNIQGTLGYGSRLKAAWIEKALAQ